MLGGFKGLHGDGEPQDESSPTATLLGQRGQFNTSRLAWFQGGDPVWCSQPAPPGARSVKQRAHCLQHRCSVCCLMSCSLDSPHRQHNLNYLIW
jgi:hypothetical protein